MSYIPEKMVLLNTKTASNNATISLTSSITSKFSTYVIDLRSILPANDGVSLQMLWSTDNGATYLAANYQWSFHFTTAGGGNTSVNNASDSQFVIYNTLGNTANSSLNGQIQLFNMDQAALFPSYLADASAFQSVTGFARVTGGGGFAASTQVNAIRFSMSAGNITSGSFYLYGIEEP